MAYSIQRTETVRDAVVRVVRELAEQNLAHVESDDDIELRIHEIRKNFKRIRAAFRLVRPAFDQYADENRRYRDAGRLLSDLRDATARIETVDALREPLVDALDDHAIDALREALVAARDRAYEDADIDALLNEVGRRTRDGIDNLDDVRLNAEGFDAIRGGLRKSYRRGCKMLQEAMEEPAVETFHTWRKRVKYHRYHVDLLEPVWRAERSGWEQALHELTDDLGRANDLAVLDEFLAAHPDAVEDNSTMRAALQRQSEQARERALERGADAYAETPDALVARFEAYWDRWTTD